jgi:hypothetical protein
MIFNSFFTQILMAAIALGVIFTYVQPTFSKIGTLQEAILQYQEESSKVTQVTGGLNTLVNKVNNIPASDLKALLIYIPDSIDHVAISRDILAISLLSGAYLEGVEYSGILAKNRATEEDDSRTKVEMVEHTFSVNLVGSYEQTKSFLLMLEQNNYPLEVHDLKMTSTETGIINSDISIVTYSHI